MRVHISVISALENYLVEELAVDNAPIGIVLMGEVYLILLDQGSSRQEFLDACIDIEQAKTAFINRMVEKSGLAERIASIAFNKIISNPIIRDLFKDCVTELRASKRR